MGRRGDGEETGGPADLMLSLSAFDTVPLACRLLCLCPAWVPASPGLTAASPAARGIACPNPVTSLSVSPGTGKSSLT